MPDAGGEGVFRQFHHWHTVPTFSDVGKVRCCRREIPEHRRDNSTWPTADSSALPAEAQAAHINLCRAVSLYVEQSGVSVATILAECAICRDTLYHAVHRCLSKHEDGQIYGFRGALPYQRTAPYARPSPSEAAASRSGGTVGAFAQLLRDYPRIESAIRQSVRTRNEEIRGVREVRQPMKQIHKAFLTACRKEGVTARQYPLNTSRLGLRTLQRYVKTIVQEEFDMAVIHAGGKRARAAPNGCEQAPAASYPFEVVEFDGHKIDLRLVVQIQDPSGYETTLELDRIWILVLLDVFTRAVIGYHIALGSEYNKDDVACALQNALTPAIPRTYGIPGLAIMEGGGFPSTAIVETAYAFWDWFKMDGAKSHLAEATLERLTRIDGCWTENGPPGQPNDRPFIERFFQVVAKHFAHRLPGTVGSDPGAIERVLGDPKGDLGLLVELTELEDMIDVTLANYNGEPHGSNGRTPLEMLSYAIARRPQLVRRLPAPMRCNLCLLQEGRLVPIKGSVQSGVRPHINFLNVRYTSPILAGNAALIGRSLRIYYDVRDIRSVKAYFEDGAELGILTAARPWSITPHSVRLRREIFRLIAERKLCVGADEPLIDAWVRMKWATARSNKKAAGALAKAKAAGIATCAPLRQLVATAAAIAAKLKGAMTRRARNQSFGRQSLMAPWQWKVATAMAHNVP